VGQEGSEEGQGGECRAGGRGGAGTDGGKGSGGEGSTRRGGRQKAARPRRMPERWGPEPAVRACEEKAWKRAFMSLVGLITGGSLESPATSMV
jgi:hypothetical protein